MTRKEVTLSRSKFQDDWKVWTQRDIYCSLLVGVACAMRIRRLGTNSKPAGGFFYALALITVKPRLHTDGGWRLSFPPHSHSYLSKI